jgi:hypothetical protein
MESENSLLFSQKPGILLYPEADEFTPHPHIFFLEGPLLFCHLCLGVSSGLLSSGLPTKILYYFLISYAFYMPPRDGFRATGAPAWRKYGRSYK